VYDFSTQSPILCQILIGCLSDHSWLMYVRWCASAVPALMFLCGVGECAADDFCSLCKVYDVHSLGGVGLGDGYGKEA
jgi:hypothetical protein